MSWTDTILSKTVGTVYSAWTGHVDPWQLNNLHEDLNNETAQALGPDADPATVAVAQAQAVNQQDTDLKNQKAYPDSIALRLPFFGEIGSEDFLKKLEHAVYVALAVGAVGATAYFALKFRSVLKES